MDKSKRKRQFKFNTQDYILYLLNRLEPANSDKLKLNKIAFFVEFGFLYRCRKELSDVRYAGITLGPVIDEYAQLLKEMEKSGKVKVDEHIVRPLQKPSITPPENIAAIIDPLIEKYSKLTSAELVALSHLTDSYKISTNNEKDMGKLIDKELAALETFFDEKPSNPIFDEDRLPVIKKADLVEYEFE